MSVLESVGILELKPCPFCGGEAGFDRLGDKFAECKKCGALGPVGVDRYGGAEMWNKGMRGRDEAIAERYRLRDLLKRAFEARYAKAYEPVPVQELWREIESEVIEMRGRNELAEGNKMSNRQKLEEGAQTLLFRHGKDQMLKTIEECGELIVALAKYRANGSAKESFAAVVDEIADVIIMAEQMRILFGRIAVDERIQVKLERALR